MGGPGGPAPGGLGGRTGQHLAPPGGMRARQRRADPAPGRARGVGPPRRGGRRSPRHRLQRPAAGGGQVGVTRAPRHLGRRLQQRLPLRPTAAAEHLDQSRLKLPRPLRRAHHRRSPHRHRRVVPAWAPGEGTGAGRARPGWPEPPRTVTARPWGPRHDALAGQSPAGTRRPPPPRGHPRRGGGGRVAPVTWGAAPPRRRRPGRAPDGGGYAGSTGRAEPFAPERLPPSGGRHRRRPRAPPGTRAPRRARAAGAGVKPRPRSPGAEVAGRGGSAA